MIDEGPEVTNIKINFIRVQRLLVSIKNGTHSNSKIDEYVNITMNLRNPTKTTANL